jgi:hypothetical protein
LSATVIPRTEREFIKKIYIVLHVKYQIFLSDFNQTWTFSRYWRKILQYQISWKSVKWEPSYSMRTDGRAHRWTDMTKLIVTFRNFVITHKNILWRHVRLDRDYNCLMKSDLVENDRCSFGGTTFGISLRYVWKQIFYLSY